MIHNGGVEQSKPETVESLYNEAFARFGVSALWSYRPLSKPTPADALVISRSLRVEGDLDARRLAERIEKLCRADHQYPVLDPTTPR